MDAKPPLEEPQISAKTEIETIDRNKRIKVGQLGCGYWGRNLLRVLAQSNDVDVRWVIDGAPGAVDHVTSRYPDLETSPDEMVLFDDDSVDAVVISTPAADHYRAAKLSLESGKHTFVEKPLAMSTTEAESLVNLANDNGLALMAGHTFLYNSAVREVKNLIDSGDLGDIYYVYSRRVNLGTVRQDVNVLWNLAPHDISIINYWLDDEATSASATGGIFLQPGIEDVVFATLSFGSGAVANIHLSWLDPHKIRTMTVVGSKKMVVFDDVSADARLTIHDMGVDITPGQMTANPFETFGQFQVAHRQGDTVIPRIPYPEPLAEEMKHFIECIRDGSQPRTGGQHAISVVRSLEMIQACLDQNKTVPIS